MIVAGALALAGLAVQAAEPTARVSTFSPQGPVPSVQQVRATFSEPMLPLGKVAAPGPFEVDCALAGDAHWVDDRTWVMDFSDQELNGQACEFRVRPGLKSLAGRAVGAPLKFGFKLPLLTDDMRRTVRSIYPGWNSEWIAEDQAFLVTYSHAMGKTPPDLRCEAPGQKEAQVQRLPAEVRDSLRNQVRWMALADDRTEAVRCPFALAPRSAVTLRHVRPGLKAEVLHFKVRALPAATVDCTRVAPEGGCAAGFPVTLSFNAALPEALLRAIRVEAPQGQGPVQGTAASRPATVFTGASSALSFAAEEFKPAAEYRIHWPEQALADADGRPLARERLPQRIQMLAPLPLAYFPVPSIAIRPLQADNAVPVFVQGAALRSEGPGVRERFVGLGGHEARQDGEILRWMDIPHHGDGVSHYFWAPGRGGSSWRNDPERPLLGDDAVALPLQAATASRNAQVRLQGAGLHLLELQGFAGQGEAAPVYDSVAVLLTRLAVHLKVAAENGAVWVTRMDDGTPVAGATLKAYDCLGNLAWQGRSDASGMATIDRKGLVNCSTHPDGGVTVIARHTWPDGVQDVSLANSQWGRLLDAASFGVGVAWGGSPTPMHTVLDRSLFKPGETVSMRHLVRKEDNTGLAPPAASDLPTEAKVVHTGSGKEWKVAVAWAPALAGDGTSAFTLPADAPLGHYAVILQPPADAASRYRPLRATAGFAVEAFRLPAMLGGITAPAAQLLTATAPTLDLALHYADGGAAQDWPVSLTAHVQAAGYRRPAALDAYPAGYRFDPGGAGEAVPQSMPLHAQSLVLDGQGHARLTLPELPSRSQPYVLHVEMSYQDPNGEAQTLSQDFDVQPSPLSVGVRTLGSLAPQRRLQVQSLVVDAGGRPQASQPVRISARRWAGYGVNAGGIEDLGEVCQGLADAQGLLTCDFVPAKDGLYQFAAAAAPAAWPASRAATGYSAVLHTAAPPPALPLFAHTDKAQYRVGETADITVASPFERARVWLTLERQGILESRLIELGAKQAHIRLPIRREWAGNVAVSLLALDAGGGAQPAAVAAGIVPLAVSTDAHALRVSVKPERPRYQPREHATVRIHVAMPDGSALPAARRLSFVAVDESLLSLKANPSWQLLAALLRPRLHGVNTTSALTLNAQADEAQMLRAAQNALIERLRRAAQERARVAAGGVPSAPAAVAAAAPLAAKVAADGQQLERVDVTGSKVADAAEPPAARTLLDALLVWQADVPVDDRGDAVVSVPIKDALSRFRLVAVASAGTEEFGTGTAVLDVAKDVQITAGLPPQVRTGDRFAALVTVRNTSTGPMALDVGARIAGQAALPAQALNLSAGESRQLSWDVRVPLGAKAMNWTFTARERGNKARQDALEVAQQVEPAVPVTVQAATLAQVNGRFDVPRFGFDSAEATDARVSVRLLPTLAGNLGGVQAWLGLYPYRCLEQTASRAIGMHDRKAWDTVMAELPRYLDDDGLANYFPRTPGFEWLGSDTLTAYLLDIADASGWPIPDAERGRMLGGLERFVAGTLKRPFWAPRNDGLARKLAAMATLARYKPLKAAQVAGIRIDPDEWTTAMLLDWLTVLRKSGIQPTDSQATQAVAQNALRARLTYQGRRMVLSTEARDYWWWLMSHGDVDAARLLLTVADLPDWKADLPRLLTGLLARQQANGAWATTNANAWGTLAVDAFARRLEPVPVAGSTRIALGGQQQVANWSTPGAKAFDAPLAKVTDALNIQHDGAGAPWASVEVRAAVPLKEPRFAGYAVSRSITPVQQKVAGQWHVGDTLRVRLSIRAQADMSWVVVSDPVPAGASLLGNGLGRDSAVARGGELRTGHAWPLYQARDFTSFKSFYRHVPRGEFSLEYTLRLNNPGQFKLPPTRVEAMYAPEVFGEAPNAAFQIAP